MAIVYSKLGPYRPNKNLRKSKLSDKQIRDARKKKLAQGVKVEAVGL